MAKIVTESSRWERIIFQPPTPLFAGKERVTNSEEHRQISLNAAREGMVLLKNDGLLPLKRGTRIALLGKACYDIMKCGGGSGDVYCDFVPNLYDAFKEKANESKIEIYKELSDYCDRYVKEKKADIVVDWSGKYFIEEPDIPEDMITKAAAYADVAIVTINRHSHEAADRSSTKGDFYLSEKEEALINTALEKFKKTAVVLNVGGQIDVEWFRTNGKIGGALLSWQAGSQTARAIADILCGDVNPSGKLADTFAKTFDDYPSSYNFNESNDYVEYTDDIYVGYRYFETVPGAAEKVSYPFGYGLSYTDFDIENVRAEDDGETVTVKALVTNTGDMDGKEVIQVYASLPQGKLGKPAKTLMAFRKTRLLKVGESQTVVLKFKINDMASYDDTGKVQMSAYILEKGNYELYVGNSVRNTVKADYKYTVKETFRVVEQLTQRAAPSLLHKRLTPDGTYEEMPSYKLRIKHKKSPKNKAKAPEQKTDFIAVAEGKITLDEFLKQCTDAELIAMLGGQTPTGMSDTSGIGNLERLGVPNVMTEDGPAGVRIDKAREFTTAFPCAILLSCTWNPDVIFEVGAAAANEIRECNFGIWLAPALNIHRNPLCGRNFEYYSEDPLVSGKCAAAMVKGIQSNHAAATVKHFACNNKEVNRGHSDSRVSERALREIYLKGFEICVKEADPWCLMTSYNKVNGIWPSESYDLVTGMLREEWGFKGLVMTDWACYSDQVKEIKAGNDVKMPWGDCDKVKFDTRNDGNGNFVRFLDSIGVDKGWLTLNFENGKISREDIELSAKHVLELILKLD